MNPFSATKVRPETKEDEEVCVIYCCNIFSCWECEKKERQTECESSAAFPERVLERGGERRIISKWDISSFTKIKSLHDFVTSSHKERK